VAVDPAGVGVNLILEDDPAGRLGSTRRTIRMTRPTVQDLLRRLSTTVGFYVRVDAHAIVIERAQTVPAR
jgi:DNA-binding IclR family transcriptional regulator